MTAAAPPLSGLRVLDLSTVVAGPGCTRYLADFGADVVKIERPGGDGTRGLGWRAEDGVTLWHRLVNRGKRSIVMDLRDPEDRRLLLDLVAEAHVLVENLRPGKLDALGLDLATLHERNPGLVVTRVTGFGQTGPYAQRPGFATIAEAMAGFAAINGEPSAGATLPPIALGDEITALVAAFATMVAVHSGIGQEVDVDLLSSVSAVMGPLMGAWRIEGYLQPRLGSGIPYTVPRGSYRTADDRWVAISTSADSVAARVLELIELGGDERFRSFGGRVEHRDELEAAVVAWVGARPAAEVLAAFEAAEAAIAPVYEMSDLAADPHVVAREMFPEVDGVPLPGLVARLSATPGAVGDHAPELDEHGPGIRAAGW